MSPSPSLAARPWDTDGEKPANVGHDTPAPAPWGPGLMDTVVSSELPSSFFELGQDATSEDTEMTYHCSEFCVECGNGKNVFLERRQSLEQRAESFLPSGVVKELVNAGKRRFANVKDLPSECPFVRLRSRNATNRSAFDYATPGTDLLKKNMDALYKRQCSSKTMLKALTCFRRYNVLPPAIENELNSTYCAKSGIKSVQEFTLKSTLKSTIVGGREAKIRKCLNMAS